jgi:hypothetical protein
MKESLYPMRKRLGSQSLEYNQAFMDRWEKAMSSLARQSEPALRTIESDKPSPKSAEEQKKFSGHNPEYRNSLLDRLVKGVQSLTSKKRSTGR